MNERASQLFSLAKANGAGEEARELVEDLAFIEERMQELRGLPFIRIDANNPEHQKATPAARQYTQLLQQYNASMKLFLKMCGDTGEDEAVSPLREWAKSKKVYDLDTGQQQSVIVQSRD